MMPLAATKPQEHAVIYSDLESGYGITVAVKTTTNWAKIIWWDGTEQVKEPSVVVVSSTNGKIVFFKISDTNASKRIVAYSTDSSGNKSGTIQMFTCYRQKDKRKRPGGVYAARGDYYAENQKVTKLDVSTCSDLRVLKCDRNKLTSLGDITACRLVETIACAGNCFENLDLSRMQNLDQLYCNFNTNLNTLSPNSGLRRLCASETALDVNNVYLPSIVQLNMRDCSNITTIDFDNRHSVLYANFSGCPNLTQAYFTECTNLHNVNLRNTPVSIVDFTNAGFTKSSTYLYFGTKYYNYDVGLFKLKSIYIPDNATMTSTDAENMYATLPTPAADSSNFITAYNNAGAAAADASEATNRNWSVFT